MLSAQSRHSDLFFNAFTHSCIGMALVGLDGRWLDVNNALCQLVGYSKNELLLLTFQDITHPDDLAPDLAYTKRLLDGEVSSYSLEKRYITKDGKFVWIALTVSLARNDDCEPDFFIAQIVDISAQRRAEQDRETYFELSPDLLAVADNKGFLTVVSPAWTDLLGWTKEELTSRAFLEFVHPEDRARTVEEAEALYAGRPTSGFRNRYSHRDGTYRWIEWNTRIVSQDRFYCAARNVTAQQEIDAYRRIHLDAFDAVMSSLLLGLDQDSVDLAGQLFLASQLFESSPDCVKILDLAGCLQAMNKNGQCSMEVDDFSTLRGALWVRLWPSEHQHQVEAALDVARSGGIGHFDAFCPTAKGTPKWWDVIVTPILDSEGRIDKFLSVSRDVTLLNRAKEDLTKTATHLQHITSSVPASIIQWYARPGGEVGFYYVSEKAEAQYGIHASHLMNEWIRDRVHPDEREHLTLAVAFAARNKNDWQYEFRVTLENGAMRWVRIRSTPAGVTDKEIVFMSVILDVTEEHESLELQRSQEEKIRLLIDNAHDAFVGMGHDGLISEWNKQAEATFGWTAKEAVGRPMADLIIPEVHRGQHADGMKKFLSTGLEKIINRRVEVPALCKDGREIIVEMTVTTVVLRGQNYFNAFLHDVSDRKALQEKLHLQATQDFLTKLPNRCEFMGRLEQAIKRSERLRRMQNLALLFIDLDGFKRVNDTLGHEIGDEVLKQFGSRLSGAVRKTDTAARLAGDEFVVLVEHLVNGKMDAELIAEKVLAAGAAPFNSLAPTCSVSASVGIALYDGEESADEFLSRADAAMYVAKQAGRNRMAIQFQGNWETRAL